MNDFQAFPPEYRPILARAIQRTPPQAREEFQRRIADTFSLARFPTVASFNSLIGKTWHAMGVLPLVAKSWSVG